MSPVELHQVMLPNGLRVATLTFPKDFIRTVHVNVLVRAGSRCETSHTHGVAHVLEHTLFDGSVKYPDKHSSIRRIENLGGVLNAFTAKELAGYYAANMLIDDLEPAFEVLSDVLLYPLFSPQTLEEQRSEIEGEIKRYLDQPADAVEDLAAELFFGKHSLARSPAGSLAFISRFSRENLFEYLGRWYFADNAVLVVSGGADASLVDDLARRYFWEMPQRPRQGTGVIPPISLPQSFSPRVKIQHKRYQQVYVHIIMPGITRAHPLRPAYPLVGMHLGYGVSSRLFRKLRTEQHLVYGIQAETAVEQDYGTLEIVTASHPQNLAHVLKGVVQELQQLRKVLPSKSEFLRVQHIREARLSEDCEKPGNAGGHFGNTFLLDGVAKLPDQRTAENKAVTYDDFCRILRECMRPDELQVALVGPVKETEQELLDIIQNA